MMKTAESAAAHKILDEILDTSAPFCREYYVLNPLKVARSLRWMLWYRKRTGIKVVVEEDVLYVKVPKPDRAHELTDMIRKLLAHVEDEKVYEEAMKLLEVTDGI